MKQLFLIIAVAVLAQVAPARVKKGDVPSPPTSDYAVKDMLGWTVYVQKPLLAETNDVGETALRLLENHLFRISMAVPGPAMTELRKIKIWLHHKGKGNVCQYHPARGWLKANGFNTDMTRCVDLGDADRFVRSCRHQPMVVLHELAHGYHDQAWGWGPKEWVAAYEAAKASGKYDKVLIHNGRRGRAYAMTDRKEYFSEVSEAYFGTNDMYPFVRAELREHDPDAVKLLEKLWAGPPKE